MRILSLDIDYQRWSDYLVWIGIGLLILILVGEARFWYQISIHNIVYGNVFELAIFFGIIGLIVVYGIHRYGDGDKLSFLINRIVDFQGLADEELDYSGRFPYWIISLCIVALVILLGIDWNIPPLRDQAYGLILDAGGAYLFGRGIFRNPAIPQDVEENTLNIGGYSKIDMIRRRETSISQAFDGGWGVILLVVGFVVQVLSLMPWSVIGF